MLSTPISTRLSLATFAGALILAMACGGGGGGGGGASTPPPPPPPAIYIRAAALRGADEVPANASAASATGTIAVDPSTLAIAGTVVSSGIVGTAAHIHEGAAGIAGPVVIPLTGGTGGVWTIPASTVLTSAQYTSLQAGNYYFNIHSLAFPAGEIRGQIKLITRFASLDGTQETPATGSSAAGSGVLSVNPISGEAFGTLLSEGLTGVAAHVHEGDVGVSGPVLLPLASGAAGAWNMPSGSLLTSAQVTSYLAGGLYGNVHSAAFPSGEIRGQFNLNLNLTRSTTLSGANEVPANASTATATGTFSFDPLTLELRGGVVVTGLAGTGAHIHMAAAGVAGPIIVPLVLAADGAWVVPPGTILSATQFTALRTGGLYVNVHSAAFPSGEIRGQIPADSTGGTGGGGGGTGGGGY